MNSPIHKLLSKETQLLTFTDFLNTLKLLWVVCMYSYSAKFNQVINSWGLRVSLEKAMAPHSSTFAWKIPWMEEPGRLQSMGSLRVGHDWVTSLSLLCIGEGNGNPLQCSCLENPRDGGAWWAAVYGVTESRTRLKRLSSSSSSSRRTSLSIPHHQKCIPTFPGLYLLSL